MANRNFPVTHKQRSDTAVAWAAANSILALGEIGFDTTNYNFKVGDGITAWNNLEFIIQGGAYTDEMAQDAVGTILGQTNTIVFTYFDDTPTIMASLKKQSSPSIQFTDDGNGLKASAIFGTTLGTVAQGNHTHDTYVPYTGGTMTGILVAQNNTAYTTKQVRNIILSNADAVLSSMADGDIWIKYV